MQKKLAKALSPPGNATKAFNRLKDNLESKKIFIVEIGELECFDKPEGNERPKWANEVLKKDLNNDPNLRAAREFR